MNFPKKICSLLCAFTLIASTYGMSNTSSLKNNGDQQIRITFNDSEFQNSLDIHTFSKRNKKGKKLFKGKKKNQRCPIIHKSKRNRNKALRKSNKKTYNCYSANKGLRGIF